MVNVPEVEQYVEIARIAEEAGFDGITAADHLVMPKKIESRYPYTEDGKIFWPEDTPWPDPWSVLSAMGAVTTKLQLASNIYLAGLRDVFTAAKAVATTAALAGKERVACGVAVGWIREEYELAGVPFDTRGRRLDEMIKVMQKLWTGNTVDHRGEAFSFEGALMYPAPGRLPVWCGGGTPPALRRAAANDGWLGLPLPLEDILETSRKLFAMREENGRAGEPFDICFALVGDPSRENLEALEAAGANNMMIIPWLNMPWGKMRWVDEGDNPASLDTKKKGIERFAREVIEASR